MVAHSLAAGAVNLGMESMVIIFYSVNIAISSIVPQNHVLTPSCPSHVFDYF